MYFTLSLQETNYGIYLCCKLTNKPLPCYRRAGRDFVGGHTSRIEEGLKFLVVLTKSDKLNKTEAAKALSIMKIQAGGGEVRFFSALKKSGGRRGRAFALAVGARRPSSVNITQN